MKTNRFFLHYPTRATFVLVLGIGLISPTVQGQTFTGQAKLTESPTSFQASVSPVATRQATIRVNIDNRSRGPVRVQISDQRGRLFYDTFEWIALYRRYFDLSSMPAGAYTILLSKDGATYTQAFRIDPPTAGRLALLNEELSAESPKSEKLIVLH